jgi:ABC-type nitrate/sulfonate/bicarbonate transport system substrate-binding protein
VDQVAQVVVVRGPDQNAALRERRVDALFTHTPHLENAVVDDGAKVIVNLSAGEVPALSGRQIHALAVTRAFARTSPRVVEGLVRAVARAEALVHRDPAATIDAVSRALPTRDRAHVATLVSLYAPAVPRSPAPSADRILRELPFYPAGDPPPDLTKVNLASVLWRVASPSRSPRELWGLAAGLLALVVAAAAVLGELRISRRNEAEDTSV